MQEWLQGQSVTVEVAAHRLPALSNDTLGLSQGHCVPVVDLKVAQLKHKN